MKEKIKEVVTYIAGTKDKEVIDSYTDTIMAIFEQQNTVTDDEIKVKLEEQLEETRQWLIGEDYEGLAERL